MSLKAPQGGQKFTPQKNIIPGTYPARLVQMIDYGLQAQKPFKGEEKKPVIEIGVTYELVDEFMKDEQGNDIKDKPRWIGETFPFHPLIADKAKSTQRYKAFDPTEAWEGDFSQALGKPINVTVVNNAVGDKVYDNIATIGPMRPKDADACPPLVNPAVLFSLDAPDLKVFNSFPKWIQDKVKSNLNFNGSPLQRLLGDAPASGAPKEEKKEEPKNEKAADNSPY